jgi:putative autoinducer-2 (AI-2) aldolase
MKAEGEVVMSWGLFNRLSRIIRPETGKTVMLAIDHGYFLGPTTGLEVPSKTIGPIAPYADALMATRGILRTSISPYGSPPVVLRVSGGNSIIGEELSNEGITTSIEDALRLNAAAVAMSIYVGSPYEHQTLMNLSSLVNEAERYSVPVLAVTAVGRDMKRDARYLALCCRIAAELGAHMVKTYHCEGFEEVVGSCPVPIVVAGGKKLPEKKALELTSDAIKDGAVGVDMGRNIFQSDDPVNMIQAVGAVVHHNVPVAEAYKMLQEAKKQKSSEKK